MITTKIAAVALVSFALLGSANATPVSLGSMGLNGITPQSVAVPFSGAFSDDFTFSIAQGNAAQFGLTSSFWGNTAADVPTMTFTLTGGSGAGVYTPQTGILDDGFVAGLLLNNLSQGVTYYLTIAGSEGNNLGNTYTLQASALKVPEPSSTALILSSLGLLGLFASRRKAGKGEA